jgi:riboflavin kinase/FMN adenylyltransferase
VAVVRFTHELSQWEPETFVRVVLVEWLRVSEVWVGANFLFGHERSGNFSLLRTLGQRYGFRADKIDPVRYKEFVVSSTRIRRLVAEGRMDEAGALLASVYVGSWWRDGPRALGFDEPGPPTAAPPGHLRTPHDRRRRPAITNIGTPHLGDVDRIMIETHVFDVDRDLYDRPVRLSFVQRMRDERPFPDADALRAQIEADCRSARRLFGRISL